MKRFCILALALMLCACACAGASKFTPPDPRLDKKITVDVSHTKLEEVVKSIAEQTGVTIKAGSGDRDWKARERRVTICAKNVDAMTIMEETTRLLGFYLSREGKEWTYIIWQDKKARDLENEMLTAEKEAEAQRVTDMRQSAIDGAEKALKMTPEEAMKLKDKDPLTAYLGGTKPGRAFAGILSSFGSQFPTEYDLMMRGKRSSIPISGLPAGLVNDALSGGVAKGIQQQSGDQGKNLTPYQLIIMPLDDDNQMADMMGVGGMMFIMGMVPDGKPNNDPFGGGRQMTMFTMMSPDSNSSNFIAEAFLSIDAGESVEEVGKRVEEKLKDQDFLSQALAKDSATEETIPTDPELTREVDIKVDGVPNAQGLLNSRSAEKEGQGKVLQELSRALGWQVYYESFNKAMPLALFIKSGKQPVYKVLIAMEKAGYKWEHGESSLRIRPNDWARRRSYEIPASYIAYYKDLLEKNGQLTMDEVASIASSLTDEQLTRTFLVEPELSFMMGTLSGGTFGGPRDLLRAYASLNQDQKQSLDTENGLPFSQLSDAQWDKLNEIITDRLGGIYVSDGSIKLVPLTVAQTKAGTLSRTFKITVQVQSEKDPREFEQAIWLMSKKKQTAMQEQLKKMEEQAAKAATQKPAPAK